MKNALMAKTIAAIIKVGNFIGNNFDKLLIGALIAAIAMGDAALAVVLVLAIFYAKLCEIAENLGERENVVVNMTVKSSEAEEHF